GPHRVSAPALACEAADTRRACCIHAGRAQDARWGLFRSEYGGSARHVRSLQEHGVRPRIFIGLEMIGYFSDKAGSQAYPSRFFRWLYPSRGDFVAIV